MNAVHVPVAKICVFLLEVGSLMQGLSYCKSPALVPVLFCYLHLQRELKKLEWIQRKGIIITIRIVVRTCGNCAAMVLKYFCLNSLTVHTDVSYPLHLILTHKGH